MRDQVVIDRREFDGVASGFGRFFVGFRVLGAFSGVDRVAGEEVLEFYWICFTAF